MTWIVSLSYDTFNKKAMININMFFHIIPIASINETRSDLINLSPRFSSVTYLSWLRLLWKLYFCTLPGFYIHKCCRGLDCMIVGFTTSCAISAYHDHLLSSAFEPVNDEVYSIQHYVIKCVVNLGQVGGFRRVLWFPPIKLTSTI